MKKALCALLMALGFVSLSVSAEEETQAFTLTTTAFLDQMTIPVLYTCQGKDISPEMNWVNVPAKTQTFALVMSDTDAPGGIFYHWVLFNIPKATNNLPEALTKAPAGALMGKNSFEKQQYNGPCPPKGKAHTYVFTLYALDSKLDLPDGSSGIDVLASVKKHTVGKAVLTGVYTPWPPA